MFWSHQSYSNRLWSPAVSHTVGKTLNSKHDILPDLVPLGPLGGSCRPQVVHGQHLLKGCFIWIHTKKIKINNRVFSGQRRILH